MCMCMCVPVSVSVSVSVSARALCCFVCVEGKRNKSEGRRVGGKCTPERKRRSVGKEVREFIGD